MDHLKVVEIAENAKFINVDKMYKIQGSLIMTVNELVKHLAKPVENPNPAYTMLLASYIYAISEGFKPENFEEIK